MSTMNCNTTLGTTIDALIDVVGFIELNHNVEENKHLKSIIEKAHDAFDLYLEETE